MHCYYSSLDALLLLIAFQVQSEKVFDLTGRATKGAGKKKAPKKASLSSDEFTVVLMTCTKLVDIGSAERPTAALYV